MNRFYSALVFSKQQFPKAHQVFKPRYNKEFFKRIVQNIDQLQAHTRRRLPAIFKTEVNDADFQDLRKLSVKYNSLKEAQSRIEKKKDEDDKGKMQDLQDQLDAIENRIMPITVNIPNRSSRMIPREDEMIDEVRCDFLKQQNLAKVLSHIKLSYINNCYSKSVVGPNSYYYFGIGAKLQDALSNYFTHELEARGHITYSGLALNRSAVVEAVNSKDLKSYVTDPCRILSEEPRYTALHLTDTSRESIIAFLTTIGHVSSNNPIRLVASGMAYRSGSTWFDSDDKKVTQYPTVHLLSMAPSIEQYSMREYEEIRDIVWQLYQQLDLPCRLIHCSIDSMFANEYDSHRIDIWLPSKQEWIPVARVSHYLDYITIRTGMKRGHMIDSMVYDGQALIAAIIENKQTAMGKFIIPEVLKSHMISPNKTELVDYFAPTNSKVLINHEQRRYLVKKEGYFHNSKQSYVKHRRTIDINIIVSLAIVLSMFVDWRGVWNSYMSEGLKRFVYNYIWYPVRWIIRRILYTKASRPADASYDEAEKPYSDDQLHEVARVSRRYVGEIGFIRDRDLPKVEDIVGSDPDLLKLATKIKSEARAESEAKKSDPTPES